jgi:hypothetical protein
VFACILIQRGQGITQRNIFVGSIINALPALHDENLRRFVLDTKIAGDGLGFFAILNHVHDINGYLNVGSGTHFGFELPVSHQAGRATGTVFIDNGVIGRLINAIYFLFTANGNPVHNLSEILSNYLQ